MNDNFKKDGANIKMIFNYLSKSKRIKTGIQTVQCFNNTTILHAKSKNIRFLLPFDSMW